MELAASSSKAAGVLRVKFFLPDKYNAQKCSFSVVFDDGTVEKVAEGIFKDYEMNDAYFTLKFPYQTRKKPKAVTVESWLYGGMGLAYLEIISWEGCFVPDSINEVKGSVQAPQHLLVNDLRWCYLGETDMNALFQLPELTRRKHGLTIRLAESRLRV